MQMSKFCDINHVTLICDINHLLCTDCQKKLKMLFGSFSNHTAEHNHKVLHKHVEFFLSNYIIYNKNNNKNNHNKNTTIRKVQNRRFFITFFNSTAHTFQKSGVSQILLFI